MIPSPLNNQGCIKLKAIIERKVNTIGIKGWLTRSSIAESWHILGAPELKKMNSGVVIVDIVDR